jgi:hypothetical protein
VEYTLFSSWADRSLDQIDARAEGKAFPEVESVSQWRFDRALEPWRARLGADHVLVTRFREGYTSDGQAIADAFSGVYRFAREQNIACLVSLTSGRIVWCARQAGGHDLRSAASAKDVVDRLLAELLPR